MSSQYSKYLAGKHANGLITKTLESDAEFYENQNNYYKKLEELDAIKNVDNEVSGIPNVSGSQVTRVDNEVSGISDISGSQVSGIPDVSESQVSGIPNVMKNIVIHNIKDSGIPDVMKNIVIRNVKDIGNQYIFSSNLNSSIKCFENHDIFVPLCDCLNCGGTGCQFC
jgi:hypothetical protein